VAELLERLDVAEEEGFVGGHRLDNDADEVVVRALAESHDELVERLHVALARHGKQAAFEQIGLVARQDQTRAVLEQPAKEFEIVAGHRAARATKEAT